MQWRRWQSAKCRRVKTVPWAKHFENYSCATGAYVVYMAQRLVRLILVLPKIRPQYI